MEKIKKCVSVSVVVAFVAFAMVLALGGTALAKKKLSINRMTVSGGSIGGTSNLSANSLAAVAYKFCKIQGTITSNSTFTQVKVLQSDEADIATVVGYQAYDAYKGEWKGKPFPDLRVMFQCNGQTYHFVVMKDSGIKTWMDLKGKRVVVGKRGFFAEDITKKIHKALDLPYGKFFTPVNLGHSEAEAALVNGRVDAYVVMSKAPQSKVVQLTESQPCRVLGLTDKMIDKVIAKFPYLLETIIPANIYKGQTKEIKTIVGWMMFGTTKKFPEDVVYAITKAFWEHQDFAAIHYAAMGKYKLKEVQRFLAAPYHKGALKYFKEKGLKVRADMIPPEAK